MNNIKKSKNFNKITFYNETSDIFFKKNTKKFNFIYIDGCHAIDYVERDMENSFRSLEKNGIMWMDDYMGGDRISIKNTMDTFLKKHEGEYKVIHKGYQLAIRKI